MAATTKNCPKCNEMLPVSMVRCRCGHDFEWEAAKQTTQVGQYWRNPDARGWKKALAIFGVVIGFLLFLTIPGWIALSSYRQWRDGRKGKPTLPWGLGALGLVAIPVGVVAVLDARLATLTTLAKAGRPHGAAARTGYREVPDEGDCGEG